jgi:hypothetical protein
MYQSFFAMPLLDWSAESSSDIVTHHFWIYWVVTVPLTLLTMFVVNFWIIVRGKKNKAISKAARMSVGFENRGSDQMSFSESSFRSKKEGKVLRGLKYVRDRGVKLLNFKKPAYSESSSSRSWTDD